MKHKHLSGEYRPTLADRFGADFYDALRVLMWASPIAILFGAIVAVDLLGPGMGGVLAALVGLLVAIAIEGIALVTVTLIASGAAGAFLSLLWPRGSGVAAPSFSGEEAMIARGEIGRAAEALRARFDRPADAVAARIRLGDLLSLHLSDHQTASVVLEEAILLRRITPREARYARSRLVDLYLGPLRDWTVAARRLREIAGGYFDLVPATAMAAIVSVLRPRPDEDGVLTGRVTDQNGNPISGATILFQALRKGTVSTEDGGYQVFNVPAGVHTILARSPDGKTQTSQVIRMGTTGGAEASFLLRE